MQVSNGSVKIESGNVNASLVPSASNLPAGAVQVVAEVTRSGAGSQALYTVTAGKTLYITGVSIAYICATAGSSGMGSVDIEVSAGTWRRICTAAAGAATSSPQGGQSAISFAYPVQVAATRGVRVTIDLGSYAIGSIVGYEV